MSLYEDLLNQSMIYKVSRIWRSLYRFLIKRDLFLTFSLITIDNNVKCIVVFKFLALMEEHVEYDVLNAHGIQEQCL